ncbi:MAG: tyrosine--tRNA ligase [Acidimicrobiaceae bacterium]|nr:tyrosine--tRNA ligase [Acidimicrobiaceae bacterium]
MPTNLTGEQLDAQVELLTFGCEYGDPQLAAAMRTRLWDRLAGAADQDRPLRVYAGYDPTAPDLHLGHSITLRAMRRFQQLGHHVIVVVGTMTAMVGDTSDRATGRPRKTADEVAAAAGSYAEQVFTILDRDRTEVVANGDWLASLTTSDLLEAASVFTVQQFLARDNYRRRIDRGEPVGLHEFFYALLQGYDAVHLRADVQLGATEQLFNILAGARLQEALGQPPCAALTYPILVGIDGTHRMSKSRGNYVGLAEPPAEQFGKTMSIPDRAMPSWAALVTDWPADEAARFLAGLADGALHPMEAKKQLAHRIVELYHGTDAADTAQSDFERTFQHGRQPATLPETVLPGPVGLIDLLVLVGAASSRSAARRLIEGGGVSLDNERASFAERVVDHSATVQVGPRRFYRVIIA